MLLRSLCLMLLATLLSPAALPAAGNEWTVKGEGWEATFQGATLSHLKDAKGRVLVAEAPEETAARLVFNDETVPAGECRADNQGAVFTNFAGVAGAKVTMGAVDSGENGGGDLVVTQSAQTTEGGLESVDWFIGYIPLEYNILVPGGGGEIMTKDSPYKQRNYNYLLGWDSQLLVIEGDNHGFYLWCDDITPIEKSINVLRTEKGWLITCRSTNVAPFTDDKTLGPRHWRVNTYTGDWRVPAKRYRDWSEKAWGVARLPERQPSWVKDIRTVVYRLRLDTELLDELAKQLDPSQTMLYYSHWRVQDFDRDWPTYDQPNPQLKAVIDHAHKLGFKVMLHTNFWGCSPDNPLYKQFEKYQLLKRNGEKHFYENRNQNPPVIIEYINPASKEWRELFIARMKEMIELTGADAIHLDQNFHAHNDMRGPIDGLSFNEGVLAFHKELKEALPNIALGGEGLNEMTYRYLDFAQRHVWSAMGGTIDRAALSVAHPIASYLMTPYLRLYGWMGSRFPHEHAQMYATWRENFKDWGVYPTFRYSREVSPVALREPMGFYRQLVKEAQYFQKHKVETDPDGPWPEGTAFPFRTEDGKPVLWTKDRRIVADGREISRTVTGVREVALPGTIDRALFYDENRIYGLDPEQFYAYDADIPRDMSRVHVASVPDGLLPTHGRLTDDFILLQFEREETGVKDLVADLPQTPCGLKLDSGKNVTETGGITGRYGAHLAGSGNTLALTPPSATPLATDLESTAAVVSRSLGEVYAAYPMKVPAKGTTYFRSEVGMEGRAIRTKKTDGMTFVVEARSGDDTRRAEVTTAGKEKVPLDLDLTPFAGREITLTLSASAGPKGDATEDRGMWYAPRVIQPREVADAPVRIANAKKDWVTVNRPDGAQPVKLSEGTAAIPAGDGLFVVSNRPFAEARAGLFLAGVAHTVSFTDLWDWPLQKAKTQPTLEVRNDDFVAFLPARAKITTDWLLKLPQEPLRFQASAQNLSGPDGSGVLRVHLAVNDKVIESVNLPNNTRKMTLRADLAPWAGKNVVLSLWLEGKDYRGDLRVEIGSPRLREGMPKDVTASRD